MLHKMVVGTKIILFPSVAALKAAQWHFVYWETHITTKPNDPLV
jgi:hypothetical protein